MHVVLATMCTKILTFAPKWGWALWEILTKDDSGAHQGARTPRSGLLDLPQGSFKHAKRSWAALRAYMHEVLAITRTKNHFCSKSGGCFGGKWSHWAINLALIQVPSLMNLAHELILGLQWHPCYLQTHTCGFGHSSYKTEHFCSKMGIGLIENGEFGLEIWL